MSCYQLLWKNPGYPPLSDQLIQRAIQDLGTGHHLAHSGTGIPSLWSRILSGFWDLLVRLVVEWHGTFKPVIAKNGFEVSTVRQSVPHQGFLPVAFTVARQHLVVKLGKGWGPGWQSPAWLFQKPASESETWLLAAGTGFSVATGPPHLSNS